MTVRVPSIKAGLAASTVTPGSTAPLASVTVPAIVAVPTACAAAGNGRSRLTKASSATANRVERIIKSSIEWLGVRTDVRREYGTGASAVLLQCVASARICNILQQMDFPFLVDSCGSGGLT